MSIYISSGWAVGGGFTYSNATYSVAFLVVGGGGGGGGAMRCIGAKAGGSGVVIIAVPAAFYPGSAPGATVTNAPPSYPGVKLLTYPATPGTYTYIA